MNSKNKQQIKFVLYIEFSNAIKNDKNLLNDYWERIRKHNKNMLNDDYYDSGFDLLMSNKNIKILKNEVKLVSLGIKCACYKFNTIHPNKIPVYNVLQTYKLGMLKGVHPHPFKLFPRSSMWKKGVLLANCTGVIDSGYRGFLFAPLYSIKDNNLLKYNNRYVQICMPGLERFLIQVVDKLDTNTNRGEGGCGSTGK